MIRKFLDVLRKMDIWKKGLIIFIALITFIRIGYIIVKGDHRDTEYIVTGITSEDLAFVGCDGVSSEFAADLDRLKYMDLVFDMVPDDPESDVYVRIFNSEKLVYEASIPYNTITPREWMQLYVNMKIEEGETYRIELAVSEGAETMPCVLVVEDGSALAANYTCLESDSISDHMVEINIWLLFLLSSFLLIVGSDLMKEEKTFLDKIRDSGIARQIIISVAELISLLSILFVSGIRFQTSAKIAIAIISVIAVINYPKKREYIKTLTNKSWKKALLFVTYTYAAFSLTGQRLLIYPFDKTPTVIELATFIFTIVWFVPVVDSFVYYFNLLGRKVFSEKKKMKTWLFALIVAVIILIPLEFYLYIYNPGISSVDTADTMITNGKFLHGMFDWHPFFYSWVTMLLTSIWDSTYIMVFSQQLMYIYIMLELFLFLRRKGFRESVLIGLAVLTGIYIPNIILVDTIWKDVPYDLALLWLFIIVTKLVIDGGYYRKKWFIYLELAVAMSVTFLLRKNGFVPVLIVGAFLIPLIIKNIRIMFSLIMSFIIILTFQFPMSAYYGVQKSGNTGVHIGLGQDIMGVYYAGGEVSNDTSEIIGDMTMSNMSGYAYTATWSRGSYYIDASIPEFVVSYMDTFARNPVMTVRAVVAREDALWDILEGDGMILSCECYTDTMDGKTSEGYYWNDYYPSRKIVPLYRKVTKMNVNTVLYQVPESVTWRCGIITLMAVMTIVTLILRDRSKRLLIILSSVLGQIMSLLLSTGWAEFRYYWGINLMNIAFISVALIMAFCKVEIPEKEEEKKDA